PGGRAGRSIGGVRHLVVPELAVGRGRADDDRAGRLALDAAADGHGLLWTAGREQRLDVRGERERTIRADDVALGLAAGRDRGDRRRERAAVALVDPPEDPERERGGERHERLVRARVAAAAERQAPRRAAGEGAGRHGDRELHERARRERVAAGAGGAGG